MSRVLAYPADIADEEAVDRLTTAAIADYGAVGVLVNNAGAPPLLGRLTGDLTWEAWRRHIDVDLRGVFNGCRRLLPLMRAQGSGTIVNLSSGAVFASSPHHHAYTPAKLAILGLSRCLATEVANTGVSIHCLCPDITPDGGVGRRAIEVFARESNISVEEWVDARGPKPPNDAASVGAAVAELVGKPSGVWHVGGAGLTRWEVIAPPPRT